MSALLSKGALALFALTAFAFAPSATATGPVAASAYSDIEVENERKLGLRGQEQNVKDSIEVEVDSARRRLQPINCLGHPKLKLLKFHVGFSKKPMIVQEFIYNGCKAERVENLLFSSLFRSSSYDDTFYTCLSEEGYHVIEVRGVKGLVFSMTLDGVKLGYPDPDPVTGGFSYEVGSKSSCPIVSRYYCAKKGVDPGDDKICMFGIEDKDLVCGEFNNCSADEECRVSKCQGREPLPAEE